LQGAISKAAIQEPGLFRSTIPISNVLNAGEPGARWQAAAVLDFLQAYLVWENGIGAQASRLPGIAA
jgi:hypothetical protein